MNDLYSVDGHLHSSASSDSPDSHGGSYAEAHHDVFHHHPHAYNLFDGENGASSFSNESVLHHHDPLSVAQHFNMPPLQVHFVQPHWVEGYTRQDGTEVAGYFRDGEGSGYLRSNPDDTLSNNLNGPFTK